MSNLTIITSSTLTALNIQVSSVNNFIIKKTISSANIIFEGETIVLQNSIVGNKRTLTVITDSETTALSNFGDSFTVSGFQIIFYGNESEFKTTDGTWECGRYVNEPSFHS